MLRYGYILLIGAWMSMGCHDFQQAVKDAQKDIPPPAKDNYIVLLDLSDRILYNHQQQVAKDLSALQNIYAIFKSNLDVKDPTHLYYSVNDKLKVLIAPQRTTPKNLYDMVGNLRVDMGSEQPEKKSKDVDETEKTFTSTLPDIYKQAVISNNSNAYSGADIWKYFKEDLEDDLEKDGQNTLFIVTDGYMDLDKKEERPDHPNRFASCSRIINALKKYPDWEKKFDEGDYGLLPVGRTFSHLRVVLLEINPKEEWNDEYSLLTKIWGKWFTEMGISSYRFIKDDNINEVRESLEKFIPAKLSGKAAPVSWKMVTDTNPALRLIPETAEEGIAQADVVREDTNHGAASKKKDSFLLNKSSDSSNIPGKTTILKNPAAKTIPKQQKQVSFGPVY